MWFLLCLLLFVICLFIYFDTKKPLYYPPGPRWFPLLGNYIKFRNLHKQLKLTHLVWEKFCNDYGPVVGLRLGLDRLVIVSGYQMAHKVLFKEEFEGRPDGYFFRLRALGQRLGVAFVDGPFGQEQRRFCIQNLKEFGLGRSSMEERITLETTELISWLRVMCKDGPLRMDYIFDISILNTLWAMLAGQRYNLGNKKLKKLLNCINESFRLIDMSGGLLNQMPFLRFIAPEKSSYNKMVKLLDQMNGFIRQTIKEHKRTLKPNITRDVIDTFLHEIEKRKGEKDLIYTEDQLVVLLLDLFMAGSETTSRTLSFAILYLMLFKNIQQNAQNLLDSVVGKGNQPTMKHRSSLGYIEAIIMEIQRICNVAATTAAHRAKCDTVISEFRIPKDAIILVSIYSVHMDKEHWVDPETFRPERFINSDGNVVHDEWFMPFSIGRRRCLGESLARGSLFLFLSTVLHNFKISPPVGQPLPSLEPMDGATLSPQPFTAILTPRF